MMNRGVMQRQMFAKGGGVFPDLSGDGKVTQRDILMGRGVPMAMGGEPQMAAMMAAQDPSAAMMPPAGAMLGTAEAVSDEQAMSMGEQSMDVGALESALSQVANNLEGLDDVQDFEQVMNSIRGDDATMGQRYSELADIVGPQDAQQTPESVLALVQPVMMLNAVDQGIGGLAQEEMTAPVEGAMAEGIMSTVAPPPQPEMMAPPPQPAAPAPMDPAMMGGPPPVNFNQGGLVRRGDNRAVQMYAPGGEVKAPTLDSLGVTAPTVSSLREVYEGRKDLYQSVLGDPTADLQKQKDLTQSQMLFDIANTALAFAAPMEGERRGMSGAERLAMAARTTQLPQTIGARAQAQLDKEAAVKAQQQKMNLSALTAAEADLAAQAKATAAYKEKELEGALKVSGIGYTKALELNNATKLQEDLYNKKDALQVKIKGIEAEMASADYERKAVLQADLLFAQGEQAKVLEGIKQKGREGLQDTINTFKEKMNRLDQEQTLDAQNEKSKLDEQLKVLEANMRLTERDLMNAFELKKLDKVHDQNTQLQKSRLGVQQDIASNRLSFDKNQAELNQARADKELGIKEENLELQQAAEERISLFDQRGLDLKEREVELKEEASQLRDFGDSFDGNITTIIMGAGAAKLADAYANDTTSDDDTIMLDGILAKYANPDKVWDKGLARYVQSTGRELPQRWREAVAARKDAGKSYPTIAGAVEDVGAPKAETPQTGNDLSEITYESLLGDLDAAKGTGAPAAFAKGVNTAFKAVLPFLDKPFSEQSRAARLINNINTQATIVYMTDVSGKVNLEMQERILETLPKPEQWFSTDQDAKNAIENTIAAFNGRLAAIDVQIANPVAETELGKLKAKRQNMITMRDAYAGLGSNYDGESGPKNKRPITDFMGG